MTSIKKALKELEKLEGNKPKPTAKKLIFTDEQLQEIDRILIEDLRLIGRDGEPNEADIE